MSTTAEGRAGLPLRQFVAVILALFFALFVLTVFVPYPPARIEAERYFSAADIERGLEFSFERRLLFWGSAAVELGVLMVLGLTGSARWLADRSLHLCRGHWLAAILAVGAVCFLAVQLLKLPFNFGRFFLLRAWGLTQREVGPWLGEYLLSLGVEMVLGAIVLVGFYWLLRQGARLWWLLAAVGGGVFAVAVAFLWPIAISPLFNTFTPLAQTEWAPLEPAIRRLLAQADVAVQDVLVMDASRQGEHTNAYFAGFGPTRRIVLYDTLLRKHTPAELESILGHELGHWLHQHIVKGILLGVLGSALGLFLLDRILRRLQGRAPWRLSSLADPAGLPLILLLGYLGSWLVMPVENTIKRAFERQADRASLELAGKPDAFEETEKKLARDNIGNVAPTPWNVWLFATHPPGVERIRMAEEWRAGR